MKKIKRNKKIKKIPSVATINEKNKIEMKNENGK